MKIIFVNLKENPYNIVVGHDILSRLGTHIQRLKVGRDAVVITNSLVRKLFGQTVSQSLKKQGCSVTFLEVADSEKSKSQKVAFDLISKIAHIDIKKKIFIIALGGGVVGDLAGFVAAVYKRGIPYIQVPTTFLAQIDSAIGGKVAIDLSVGKNLVGSFYQPCLVFSDTAVLQTLSLRQIRNGLAEAIKYGMIKDKKLFALIEDHAQQLLSLDEKWVVPVVVRCSQIKAKIVSQDEKEKKALRTILNFGHTLGHAIETAGGYQGYQHGEAVSLGMRMACFIAKEKRMFSSVDFQRLENLLDLIGLPQKIEKISFSAIEKASLHDKKNILNKNRFVLPKRIGSVVIAEGIAQSVIKRTIKEYLS